MDCRHAHFGATIAGPTIIYDDDGGYLAAALAEKLRGDGVAASIITPHRDFARWTRLTLEQDRLRKRMRELGVRLECALTLRAFDVDGAIAEFNCADSGESRRFDAARIVMVASRIPNDNLYHSLAAADTNNNASVHRIGDCEAPGLIAHAIFSAHHLARTLGQPGIDVDYRRN